MEIQIHTNGTDGQESTVRMQFCNEGWAWVYMASFWECVYSWSKVRGEHRMGKEVAESPSGKSIIGGNSSLSCWGHGISVCPLMVDRLVTD